MQAKVQQQGAGTSERVPLKDRSQAAREPAKQGAKVQGSVFAFIAAAVLVLVAAAGGIAWFTAGMVIGTWISLSVLSVSKFNPELGTSPQRPALHYGDI